MSTDKCTTCHKDTDEYELMCNGGQCERCWEKENDNRPADELDEDEGDEDDDEDEDC